MRLLTPAAASVFLALAFPLLTGVAAHAAVACHKINAKGVGQDLGGGMTTAQIVGGGILHGSTQGSFTITGGSAPVFLIGGTVTFTNDRGSLTVAVSGTFNVATGEFVAAGPVALSTGRLDGATGTLVLAGVQDLTNGKFVEEVTGLVCVDLAP
ncbi:MAG: hypothetical protein ABIO45_18230 [Burkholderiaceae bacterium]